MAALISWEQVALRDSEVFVFELEQDNLLGFMHK